MEQRDYILREIEKTGLLLRKILNSLTGDTENSAIITNRFEEVYTQMHNETGIDINKILSLNETNLLEFFLQHKEFNTNNIEMLAEILLTLGLNDNNSCRQEYLGTALRLYSYSAHSSKTFSVGREHKMNIIENMIKELGI